MKLHGLTLGPIIGDTTADHARIWGRARVDKLNGKPRRAFGVLHYRRTGLKACENVAPFKMNPNFDMTAIVVIEGLKSKQVYDYHFAYFFSDAELDEGNCPETGWEEQKTNQFRTASDTAGKTACFIRNNGSFRYVANGIRDLEM